MITFAVDIPENCSNTKPVLTRAAGALHRRDHMRPVLRDGLDGQLMLAHYSDRLYGAGLRRLENTSRPTYRRGRDGGNRLHFHWDKRDKQH